MDSIFEEMGTLKRVNKVIEEYLGNRRKVWECINEDWYLNRKEDRRR